MSKDYEEVERNWDYVPVNERPGSDGPIEWEEPLKGGDGKYKETDELGNEIDHGFLGPRRTPDRY